MRIALDVGRWVVLSTALVMGAVVPLAACGPAGGNGGPSGDSPADAPKGDLLNPKLPDGKPVMMGFDSHHPDCFTFPENGQDSQEVECPEGVMKILHDCRGAKLYRTGPGQCSCVPVSGEEPENGPCPAGALAE